MVNSQTFPYGVIVLYNESQKLIKGEPDDLISENAVIACAEDIAAVLSEEYCVEKVPIRSNVESELTKFSPLEWVIFNLAEGIEGRLFECARIAWALETMGFLFTGPGGDTLLNTTKKDITQKILKNHGILTPESYIIRDSMELIALDGFPYIVKPIAEDGSLGISNESIVLNQTELRNRIEYIRKSYCQNAIIEKYIGGREINISIWGNPPEILPLCEINFQSISDPNKKIVSYKGKWEPESSDYIQTPAICPAEIDKGTEKHIADIAIQSWHALDSKDYARVDVRLDEIGNVYVIDFNCNPDLSRDAGFYRSAAAAGYSYSEMVRKIVHFVIPN